MARTRSSRMMAGPNLMIERLRRMDLSVAPPTWLPVILSIKALISLPSSREGYVRFAMPTLSQPWNPCLRRCYWSAHPVSTDSGREDAQMVGDRLVCLSDALANALPVTLFTFAEEYSWRGYLLLLERLASTWIRGLALV